MRPLLILLAGIAIAVLALPWRFAAAASGVPDPAQSVIYVVGNSSYATVGSSAMIHVLLKDSGGNVLIHNIALKQVDGSPATVQFVPGPPFGYQGVSFSVTSNTAGIVTFVPVDTDTGTTLELRASIEFTLPHNTNHNTPTPSPSPVPTSTYASAAGIPAASKSSIRVDGPSSVPADGTTPITIVVQFADLNGTPILGHTVALKQVAGSAQLTVAGARYYGCCSGPADRTMANPFAGGVARFSVTSSVAHPVVTFVPQDLTTGTTLSSLPVTISFTVPHPVPSQTPHVVASPTPPVTTAGASTCPAHSQQEIVDENVGRFFCFAGVNLRVDSVQTFPKADNDPLLTKNLNTAPDADLGYIVVKVTMQNRSRSQSITYPGNWLGFDLADGSKMELGVVSGEYAGAALAAPPDTLAPGETVQTTYVVVNWNRSPIRTMYLFRNVGNGQNDPGVQYARFNVAGM